MDPSLNSCLLLISFFTELSTFQAAAVSVTVPGLLELIIAGTEVIANEAALNLLAASLFC